ncbi:hypothetical protein KR084_010461 [Drosophila pseudotakahashii]|nr:hypothetical protein KR084_010461 [Drosophila pseudotakahashii]
MNNYKLKLVAEDSLVQVDCPGYASERFMVQMMGGRVSLQNILLDRRCCTAPENSRLRSTSDTQIGNGSQQRSFPEWMEGRGPPKKKPLAQRHYSSCVDIVDMTLDDDLCQDPVTSTSNSNKKLPSSGGRDDLADGEVRPPIRLPKKSMLPPKRTYTRRSTGPPKTAAQSPPKVQKTGLLPSCSRVPNRTPPACQDPKSVTLNRCNVKRRLLPKLMEDTEDLDDSDSDVVINPYVLKENLQVNQILTIEMKLTEDDEDEDEAT